MLQLYSTTYHCGYVASVELFLCQVSIGQCTEGIVQVSEKTKTLNPRQQDTFVFEISASLNMDFQHNCTSEYVVATHNCTCY